MEFQVLGQVRVRAGDQLFSQPARPQQLIVLAALVVDAPQLVPSAVLLDRVWGAEAPPSARHTLHTHITRIRALLGKAAPGPGTAGLRYYTGGYILDIDPEAVDLHRFRQLVDRAREAGCSDERRADLLHTALQLWCGEPLAGLAGAWVDRMRHGWRQQWLNVVLMWADTQLRLGNSNAVILRLTELVEGYPLVEPLTAALMRALYAAGRAPEAMRYYLAIREQLVQQLGVDPGSDLQQLHRAILRNDPLPGGRRSEQP